MHVEVGVYRGDLPQDRESDSKCRCVDFETHGLPDHTRMEFIDDLNTVTLSKSVVLSLPNAATL